MRLAETYANKTLAQELAAKGLTDEDLGSAVIESAAAAGVEHLIYSSGIAVAELTNGTLSIPGLDSRRNSLTTHTIIKILIISLVK